MSVTDPLVPSAALLPLVDTRCGGQRPVEHVPGPLRPFAATLAVVPVECGKHDTTATKWDETQATEDSSDGNVDPDTVVIPRTDT